MIAVDSQIHIWEQGNPPSNHLQVPFNVDDLLRLMDIAHVDRAILVPPLWDPDLNSYSLAAAQKYPQRFRVMGIVDLSKPQSPDEFTRWMNQDGMLGVRISFNNPKLRANLTRGIADWLFEASAENDVPLMILSPYLCPLIGMIARRYPKLRLIVDHMAIPRGWKSPEAFEHWPELLALAQYDNVAVKMGGVPNYANGESYPFPNMCCYLRQLVDTFGANRCFWASDYSRLIGPYENTVNLFREGASWLSDDEREYITGRGICQWLNWEV